jgi:hypothetical protein
MVSKTLPARRKTIILIGVGLAFLLIMVAAYYGAKLFSPGPSVEQTETPVADVQATVPGGYQLFLDPDLESVLFLPFVNK